MPRMYKRKTVPKYDVNALIAAVESVKNGNSIYKAAKTFNVPKNTIRNRIKRNTDNDKQGAGHSQLIPAKIEDEIAECILFLSSVQQPMTRGEIATLVQEYFKENKLKNPFSKNNNGPGREWMIGFLKRHPLIAQRKAQPLQKACMVSATPAAFNKFFNLYESKIESLNIKDPAQIVNLDETGYSSNVGASVLAQKGAKCVSQVQGGTGKETFSVDETVCANGNIFPPFIIYKSKNLYDKWCIGGPEGAAYVTSENGWQNKTTFLCFFKQFIKWTEQCPKPILVLYDGHGSHIQYAVSKLAIDNQIHIISLPAHSSDKVQPLNVGVFAPAKTVWLKIKRQYARESSHKNITKEDFPGLMRQMRELGAFKEDNIRAGFRSSGMWPVNRQKALSKLPESVTQLEPTSQTATPVGPIAMPVTSTPVTPTAVTLTPVQDQQKNQNVEKETLLIQEEGNPQHPDLHDVSSFRKILLHHLTPKEQKPKATKKRLNFNNMALTESDVMDKMKEYEEEIEAKRNKVKRKKEQIIYKKNCESQKLKAKNKAKSMPKERTVKKIYKKPKKEKVLAYISSSEDDDSFIISDSSGECNLSDLLEAMSEEETYNLTKPCTSGLSTRPTDVIGLSESTVPEQNDYVVAVYDNKWFIAQVQEINLGNVDPLNPKLKLTTYYNLKFTVNKGENKFMWPEKEDEFSVPDEDLLCVMDKPPIPVSSRGYIGLEPELHRKVKNLFYNYLLRD